MKFSIKHYKTLVFDCDGVILNSNHVKTKAFYEAALSYGEDAAQSLVDYHVANGGISRYKKFAYFLEQLIGHNAKGPGLDELLKLYAKHVHYGLMTCEIAEGLEKLRRKTNNTRWLVVSGGDQNELRTIFIRRDIAHYFDGGIFGSPNTKDEILGRELSKGNIQQPSLFLGDSKYDYESAIRAGLDFLFLSKWSDMKLNSIVGDPFYLNHISSICELV